MGLCTTIHTHRLSTIHVVQAWDITSFLVEMMLSIGKPVLTLYYHIEPCNQYSISFHDSQDRIASDIISFSNTCHLAEWMTLITTQLC